MHTSPRIFLTLFGLFLLATGLAVSMPGDSVARTLFDSPPPTETPTPTATPLVTETPTPTPTETPAAGDTPTASPVASDTPEEAEPTVTVAATDDLTDEPAPFPTQTFTPELTPEGDVTTVPPEAETPTGTPEGMATGETPAPLAPAVPGFLPAPTLTSPDVVGTGGFPSLAPNLAPPLTGPAAPAPAPAPETENTAGGVPSAAQLIDNGLVALSYVWLCCGVLFLIGATLGLVWLVRSSRRRSRGAGTPRA